MCFKKQKIETITPIAAEKMNRKRTRLESGRLMEAVTVFRKRDDEGLNQVSGRANGKGK